MTTPLYQSVVEAITNRVVSGELGPGAILPSEKDLGAELGVSQGTARKGLSLLEGKGILQRRQGLGTFVATTTPESALFHFFRLRDEEGSQVQPHLLAEKIKKRNMRAAERAVLTSSGDKVYELVRVRAVNGKPVVRETIIFPVSLFPGLHERGELPNALYALFQRSYGIAVVGAKERLKAAAADEADAAALDVVQGSPLLQVDRRAIDIMDRVVEIRSSRYVTGDLHYDISLR